MEQHRKKTEDDGSCSYFVKVSKQGDMVTLNNDKALCLLARDYKGFGNQAMNGVMEYVSK